jgi:hypothetical protein
MQESTPEPVNFFGVTRREVAEAELRLHARTPADVFHELWNLLIDEEIGRTPNS